MDCNEAIPSSVNWGERQQPPAQRPWGVSKPLINDGFFELRTVKTNFEIEHALYTRLGCGFPKTMVR
jgi:hypothetical protein